jgi:hypothetical protein
MAFGTKIHVRNKMFGKFYLFEIPIHSGSKIFQYKNSRNFPERIINGYRFATIFVIKNITRKLLLYLKTFEKEEENFQPIFIEGKHLGGKK